MMADKPTSERPQPSQPGHPSRILVVDDEDMSRDVLVSLLHRKGYQVGSAPDGKTALAMFRDQSFDLVLSDVRMPGISGLQLLAAIKEISPTVPVIMLSGYGDVETVVEALKGGAENFLAKPVHMASLERVVDQVLAQTCLPAEAAQALPEISQTTSITLPSRPDLICQVVNQVALSALAVGFCAGDLHNDLRLALVEGVTNAMEHGNRWDPAKNIQVEVTASAELLEVRVRDQGPGFDIDRDYDPTREDNLMCERGRGIFLMRAIMDEVIYENPGNVLIMRKGKHPA